MSQPSLDAANRRKILTKVIIFVAMVAVVWLQPKVQSWLDRTKAGEADISDVVADQDSTSSNSTQSPADRRRVVIKDVDEPPVAEVDRSESRTSATANIESAASKTTKKKSDADLVRIDPPNVNSKRSTAEDRVAADTQQPDTAAPKDESRPESKPVLGKLHEIRNNVFESTAGLRYVPGSADNHRLRHVMQHAKDDATKPIHGVFEGDRNQILAVIDEAYQKAKSGGRDVRSETQNDRLVYTVNLGRKIGYMGGSEGERKGNPDCRYIRIVLEEENIVISAYPTKSF